MDKTLEKLEKKKTESCKNLLEIYFIMTVISNLMLYAWFFVII